MRILFITATRIGDAVLSTGLLNHLLRAHPHAKVVVACGPAAEGVFARMPNRAWTIPLSKRRFRLHWWELWRQVAGSRWDLVVDLRASGFAWAIRAKRRVVMPGGRRPGHRLAQLGALLGLDPAAAARGLVRTSRCAARGDASARRRAMARPRTHRELGAEGLAGGALRGARQCPHGAGTDRLPGARVAVLGGPGAAERAMAAPVLDGLGEERAVEHGRRAVLARSGGGAGALRALRRQ